MLSKSAILSFVTILPRVHFISCRFRSLAFLDPERPPGETGSRADEIAASLEGDTTARLRVFQLVEIGDMTVDQHCVGQRPQVLGGLQLGRVRWQEEQVDVLGHPQAHAGMPPGLVEHEHELLVGSRSRLLCEGGQLDLKEVDTHGGGEMEERPAGGGMGKADQSAPGEAMLDEGVRARTGRRPDAAQQRLEPNAMLVGHPQFHGRLWKRGRHRY